MTRSETSLVSKSEQCFKLLYDWYREKPNIGHIYELKESLRRAQNHTLVDEIENFSKANYVFDSNKIKNPEKQVTCSDVDHVASNLGKEHRHVLRFLEIKQNVIEQAEEDHKDTYSRIFHPLKKLMTKLTRQSLCNALCYANENKIINDLNSTWNEEAKFT